MLHLLRPVAGERFEEVLADTRAKVDDAGPDAARSRRTSRGHNCLELFGPVGEPWQDRSHSDPDLDASIRERADRSQAARRRCRARLGGAPDALVERGEGDVNADRHFARRRPEDVDVADDERAARDDRERRPRGRELPDARPCEPEPRFSRLVRIGRGAERDFVVFPGRARELAAEHLGDIWLDANRPAVPIVGRAICALLEVPDVTERAPVHAAHVRVERPA